MSRSRGLIAATLVALARPLAAQQVRGVVRDLGSSLPLPGAIVTAVDSAGTNGTRAIADAQGRFSIALRPRADHLHVVRIGFRPRDVAVPPKPDALIEIAMERIPPMLEAVKVSDKELCPGSNERGAAFALWEQARDGLLAAVVARELKPASVRMLTYDRRLNPGDQLVREQHTSAQAGSATRPYQASAGASYFAKVGYMSDDGNGSRVYNAPDADVLLDPAFAATHCFHLQRADRDHPGEIGLAFVPAPGRENLVDVDGVIWLDQTTPQLRTFDFQYTSLEPPATQMHAGGHLEFRTMANGISFVQRWWLRLPVMTPIIGHRSYRPYQPGAVVLRQDRDDLTLLAITEAGGEVLDATWPDGETWHAPPTTISGEVVQRKSTLPAAYVAVSLAGTSDSATTDSAGHFVMTVLPGKYTLVAADTLLREFIADRTESRVVLAERDKTTHVRIEVDRVADVVADVCHGHDVDEKHAIVIGRMSVTGGGLPPGSHVVADWQSDYLMALEKAVIEGKRQDSPVDDKGRFVVCGVVRERPIHLRLYAGAAGLVADTTFKIYDTRLTYVFPWRLSGSIMARGATFAGTIVSADQRPLPGATVLLPQLQRSGVTDTVGRFQIGALKPGTYSVEIRRVGYAQLTDSVTLSGATQVARSFTLRSETTLDTMRAIAAGTSRYISPNLREFEQRSRTGQGTFIVDSVLRRHDTERVSAVLRAFAPVVQIQSSGASAYVVATRDGRLGRRALQPNSGMDRCYATVYLDGLLLFDLAAANSRDLPPNINEFRVNDLAGIEYHSADGPLPPKFRSSECGTLLLWTRER